ncbi:MAG TPA: MFS transporter, partial [Chloroflexota bacterium]|nr:MFS transporter [Chloroflexota bacterium]
MSSVGDQMQQVAIGWQLYLLTNSPLQVGLVGAVRSVPFIALSLAGGALADAMDRRRMLWITNALQTMTTMVLVVTTMTGTISPHLIYAMAFIQGGTTAFDAPTRQAMIPNLVPRPELTNAFTLNTLLRQTSVIVGPAVGGVVIASFGLGWTYTANAISFVAVVLAVILIRPMPRVQRSSGGAWERVVGGWRFAR